MDFLVSHSQLRVIHAKIRINTLLPLTIHKSSWMTRYQLKLKLLLRCRRSRAISQLSAFFSANSLFAYEKYVYSYERMSCLIFL